MITSIKRTLVVGKNRCMLASLADGTFFALRRGGRIYRRAYDVQSRVVGVPVNTHGEQLGGPPQPFAEPHLTMVYPVTFEGGAA